MAKACKCEDEEPEEIADPIVVRADSQNYIVLDDLGEGGEWIRLTVATRDDAICVYLSPDQTKALRKALKEKE